MLLTTIFPFFYLGMGLNESLNACLKQILTEMEYQFYIAEMKYRH